MESSRNYALNWNGMMHIIKGGQNGVKSQRYVHRGDIIFNYKGGAKWSQVATAYSSAHCPILL